MKAKDDRLEKAKELIIDNLFTLQEELEELTNFDFPDPESKLYNELTDLIDETETIDLLDELEIIIQKAEDIEKTIDNWLAKEGQNTLGLTWPNIS